MSERRAEAIQLRKVLELENPWLARCCWSCKHSDVTYHLDSLVCRRLQKRISYNHLCNLYHENANNPYGVNERKSAYDNAFI